MQWRTDKEQTEMASGEQAATKVVPTVQEPKTVLEAEEAGAVLTVQGAMTVLANQGALEVEAVKGVMAGQPPRTGPLACPL